jgi:hypothetical protein
MNTEGTTMNTTTCQLFATVTAKQHGITYKEAVKRYPRGYTKNSVYHNASEITEAHCIHCARAEAIQKEVQE